MNRRYLILIFIIIMILIGTVAAKSVWSIADPSDSANADTISSAESQGYWNFQYDDAAPYTTAGLFCCWWERVYKWGHRSSTSDSSATTMYLSTGGSSNSGSSSVSTSQVETKSFCPSCCATCDDEEMSDLLARSEAILAQKPWLKEGTNNKKQESASTVNVKADSEDAQMVMTFSEET
jgi:hypothetical protein